MHDEILDEIVFNAFNGFGDSTGSDEFGVSFAWIDLLDYVEPSDGSKRPSEDLSAEFIAFNGGHRYALVYISSDGIRGLFPYDTKEAMMREFRGHERAFLQFEDRDLEENEGE